MELDQIVGLLNAHQAAAATAVVTWLVTAFAMLALTAALKRRVRRLRDFAIRSARKGAKGKAAALAACAAGVALAAPVGVGPPFAAYAFMKPDTDRSMSELCREAAITVSEEGASPAEIDEIAHFCDEKDILSALAENSKEPR